MLYIKNDGSILYFCSGKCRKNSLKLKRDTRKLKWTTYFKKEVGQGHDHLEWMQKNFGEYRSLGLLFVGPKGKADAKANPSDEMGICELQHLCALRDRLLALIEDLRTKTPVERLAAISETSENKKWSIDHLRDALWSANLVTH